MGMIVMGGQGFVGSAFVRHAETAGEQCLALTRENYARRTGASCEVFINANGNSRKYLAEQDPATDFELSVSSVMRSLRDFSAQTYVYLSSTAVYPDPGNPTATIEHAKISPARLSIYGFHKLLAETLVRKYAESWLIVRLGGMVGVGLHKGPIFDLLTTRSVRVGWRSEFQLLSTDFVARVVYRLAHEGVTGEILNVCGRGGVVLSRVYEQVFGISPEPNGLSDEAWRASSERLRTFVDVPDSEEVLKEFLLSDFGQQLLAQGGSVT